MPIDQKWDHYGTVSTPCGQNPVTKAWETLPNYPGDLNAMHEAEKMLSDTQVVHYRLKLSENSDGRSSSFSTVESAMCHATAAQRCENLLRTVGLWKEDE
jgi:hypothetical protein